MDPVKKDGKLKEQVQREVESKKIWQVRWGQDYGMFYKWLRENGGLKRNKMDDNLLTCCDPNAHLLSEKCPKTSAGVIGWRARIPFENPRDMYISPRYTIHPPGMEPQPYRVIFLG